MELGLFSLMTMRDHPDGFRGVMSDTRTMVESAEELGFDIAWFAEHHFANYSICPSPLTMAAYAAGWTKKIKLGTGVIVLPLYNPLRVAQEIAFLDLQSNGRSIVGLGTGYQQFEFDRYGVKIDDKVGIFLEYWDIIEKALVEGAVEYKGKFISVPQTSFAIKPLQQPLPPLYIASSHPAILARFKRWNAVPFIAASTLGSPVLYKMADGLEKNWQSIGEDPAQKPLGIMQYVHITDSKAEALEAGERARYVGRMAHHLRSAELPLSGGFISDLPYEGEQTIEQYAENMVVGDAHLVAHKVIADIKRVNPTSYTCNFQFGCMPLERAQRSLLAFKKDVIPLIERELGPILKIGRTNTAANEAA